MRREVGDLLFVGQPDGYLVAVDLNNQGREVWRWQTGAGLGVGNMISYAIDGEQYVAVLSGGIGLEYNTAGGDSLWASARRHGATTRCVCAAVGAAARRSRRRWIDGRKYRPACKDVGDECRVEQPERHIPAEHDGASAAWPITT